jgi:hypothetical protein
MAKHSPQSAEAPPARVVDLDAIDFAPLLQQADLIIDLTRQYLAWAAPPAETCGGVLLSGWVESPTKRLRWQLLTRAHHEALEIGNKFAVIGVGARHWIAAGEQCQARVADYTRFPDPEVRVILQTRRPDSFAEDLILLASLTSEYFNRFPRNGFDEEKVAVADLAANMAIVVRRLRGELGADNLPAYRVGNKRYQVGDQAPIMLGEAEDHVLRSLIDLGGAATKSQLYGQTGKDDCPRILKKIREKHAALAPHIILPGGKGQGGYRTTIRAAE